MLFFNKCCKFASDNFFPDEMYVSELKIKSSPRTDVPKFVIYM